MGAEERGTSYAGGHAAASAGPQQLALDRPAPQNSVSIMVPLCGCRMPCSCERICTWCCASPAYCGFVCLHCCIALRTSVPEPLHRRRGLGLF